MSAHRRHFLSDALADLDAQLQARGSRLLQIRGAATEAIPQLARALGVSEVVCEDIAAPEEREDVAGLRAAGLTVTSFWQSSLLAMESLPFPVDRLPQVYTVFRQSVETRGVLPPEPEPIPERIPPLPALGSVVSENVRPPEPPSSDARSSFPYATEEFRGGETAALGHLTQ
jgi:deoxyribodipyrimidine photo-lyase